LEGRGFFWLAVTAEALQAIICSKSATSRQPEPADPKFQVEGVAPTSHSFSQKTRVNDRLWYKNMDRFFFSFVTIHAFISRTDRILITRPRLHSMQRGKNWRFLEPSTYYWKKNIKQHSKG